MIVAMLSEAKERKHQRSKFKLSIKFIDDE
jgi:hypothetical protein